MRSAGRLIREYLTPCIAAVAVVFGCSSFLDGAFPPINEPTATKYLPDRQQVGRGGWPVLRWAGWLVACLPACLPAQAPSLTTARGGAQLAERPSTVRSQSTPRACSVLLSFNSPLCLRFAPQVVPVYSLPEDGAGVLIRSYTMCPAYDARLVDWCALGCGLLPSACSVSGWTAQWLRSTSVCAYAAPTASPPNCRYSSAAFKQKEAGTQPLVHCCIQLIAVLHSASPPNCRYSSAEFKQKEADTQALRDTIAGGLALNAQPVQEPSRGHGMTCCSCKLHAREDALVVWQV